MTISKRKARRTLTKLLMNLLLLVALTASILFVLNSFSISIKLDGRRVEAIFSLEVALFFAASWFLTDDYDLLFLPEEEERLPPSSNRDAAIAYCKEEIAFYDKVFTYNHKRWKLLQVLAIVLGSIATVFSGYKGINTTIQITRTITISAATIASGLMASFAFQQEALRQGSTSDLLKGELIKFQANAKPYEDDAPAVSEFLTRIRDIITTEQRTWLASSQSTTPQTPVANK